MADADWVTLVVNGDIEIKLDLADLPRVRQHTWYRRSWADRPSVYLQRSWKVDGVKHAESLHRFIMGCKQGDGVVVDHINGDTLDNRRCNLRLTDRRGNATNIRSSKLQKLGGYKGVSWNPRAKKWQASICAGEIKANGKRRQLYLGVFTDPAEAARAYDAAALRHFGDFAALNFPSGWLGPLPPPSEPGSFDWLRDEWGGR